MYIPTSRQIEIFEGIAPEVDRLLEELMGRPGGGDAMMMQEPCPA